MISVPGSDMKFLSKTITYTGGAGAGVAGGSTTVFTVTGEVLVVALVPYCTVNLGESGATATISLGVTSSAALFIANTNSVDIDAGEFWVDTTPDANGVAVPSALKDIAITDNIITTHGTTNTNAGAIRFNLWWLPLSADANVS